MTDGQLAALITAIVAALGSIAGAIKWGIGRAAAALDRNTDSTVKALERNSDVMVDNTASNAVLCTKIDTISQYVVSQTEAQAAPNLPKAIVVKRRTPGKGTPVTHNRPNTNGDE